MIRHISFSSFNLVPVLLIVFFSALLATANFIERDVTEPSIASAATFAVTELRKLSSSDVYSSLSLTNVWKAYEQEGIFHFNVVLNLELSSPQFLSGMPRENFTMVVLTHLNDGAKSIAIDEFPAMQELAIEKFQTEKLKRRRVAREGAFLELEVNAILRDRQQLESSNRERIEQWLSLPVEQQLDRLTSAEFDTVRAQESADFAAGQDEHIVAQEEQVCALSVSQLYETAVGLRAATDFAVFRAKQVLDLLLLHARSR